MSRAARVIVPAAVLAALLLVGMGKAAAQPPFHIVQGTATLDGTPAAAAQVRALVGNTPCATADTDGDGRFLLEVPLSAPLSPPGTPAVCLAGATLTFTVAGFAATESVTLKVAGWNTDFTLTAVSQATGWSAAAFNGWNNMLWLGADGSAIAAAMAGVQLPAGRSALALWKFVAADQSWLRNLYIPGREPDLQIPQVSAGETFWLFVK